MINRNSIKVSILSSVFMLMYCGIYGQSDSITILKNYKWCIEWLEEMKPAILFDTLGKYGGKGSAIDRLLKEDCDFVGELFPVIENYFGPPDKKINYSNHTEIVDREWSMRYVLFKPPGTSTTGMEWLIIDCDKDYRILKLWVFIIDE